LTIEITFHYPPELFNLLVDTIPLLNRSKKNVLLFIKGAGVPGEMLADIETQLREAPDELNKFQIVRTVLERLNSRGEAMLFQRRELLKRVVDFSNFDSCWPNDQLAAKGLVASIREIVNQKDAFTRMDNAREEERRARMSQAEAEAEARRRRSAKIAEAKKKLFRLFSNDLTPQARGKALEDALSSAFAAYDISVSTAFHHSTQDIGTVEQIDGVISFDGHLYVVEMKWYSAPVGVEEISPHLVRLMGRSEARGLFISASDYTAPAIETTHEMLSHKMMILATLQELIAILEREGDLVDMLRSKVNAAVLHKNPFFTTA
jgi:hypothetical protein